MDVPAGDEGTVSMKLPQITSSFRLMVEGINNKGLKTLDLTVLILQRIKRIIFPSLYPKMYLKRIIIKMLKSKKIFTMFLV